MRTGIGLAISLVVAAASTALFIDTPGAIATQGFAVIAGQFNTATQPTTVHNTAGSDSPSTCVGLYPNGGVVACGSTGVQRYGGQNGVYGRGTHFGVAADSPYAAVHGRSAQHGVQGETDSGTGVLGFTTGGSGYGVVGQTSGTGSGVYGHALTNGTGVYGESDGSGTGVYATSAGGAALQVKGKAKFSRSGIVNIPQGTSSKSVSMGAVTSNSIVIATAQQSASVYVKAAVAASGSFKIYLTGNAPSGGLKVAYFVLN